MQCEFCPNDTSWLIAGQVEVKCGECRTVATVIDAIEIAEIKKDIDKLNRLYPEIRQRVEQIRYKLCNILTDNKDSRKDLVAAIEQLLKEI